MSSLDFHPWPEDLPPLVLDGLSLSVDDVVAVARFRRRVRVSEVALHRVRCCRVVVDLLLEQGQKVYGLTTGFGKLRDVAIPRELAAALQRNLIESHACGTGDPFDEDVVRAAILLRINTLCRGNSGVRTELIARLVELLNDDVFPYVPEQGSVGASGDLAPLSHLGLVLMGHTAGRYFPRARRQGDDAGVVRRASERDFVAMPEPDALEETARREGWRFRPIALEAKEGLAINNGTQFMSAVGALALYDALFTLRFAELGGAMSLEAQRGVLDAWDPRVHAVRPHAQQGGVAERVVRYCEGSRVLPLYLNSAHLNRARHHLDDALFHLEAVREELALSALPEPASLGQVRADIRALRRSLDALIPADDALLETWAEEPPRAQIQRFNRLLARPRQEALAVLATLQQQTFPRAPVAPSSDKAETALVGVVDQLNRAVPDAPLVQDDYSLRCTPQVLAGAWRALAHVHETVRVELNSATDNPLLFPPEPPGGLAALSAEAYADWLRGAPELRAGLHRAVIGAGNFHGQPISTVMDYLAIAMTDVGSLCERRVAHLVDESQSRGLPAFLVEGSGLNSGFMIPQYTAAALVAESKVLSHPASVDTIPTSAGSEDHVSMGTHAARKAAQVVRNVRTVVAIELLAAAQGLRFRAPLEPGRAIRRVLAILRAGGVEPLVEDRPLYLDMRRVEALMEAPALRQCLLAPAPAAFAKAPSPLP